MKIVIISQYFATTLDGIPEGLAYELVQRGHTVTVITGQYKYPNGELMVDSMPTRGHLQSLNGVDVWRIPYNFNRSLSAFQRLWSYLTFALSAIYFALRHVNEPDILWTYQIGLPGAVLSILWRRPLVHNVQDLWPDWSEGTVSGIRGGLFYLLDLQQKWVYWVAQRITTISSGFKWALQKKGVNPKKIMILSNWVNPENVKRLDKDPAFSEAEGFLGKFNIVYTGNIGTAQGLDIIIRAAELLRNQPHFQFTLVGDGVERVNLLQEVEKRQLNNVRLLSKRPLEDMPRFYSAADVLFLALGEQPMYTITIPSKSYAYLAAGRPIIAACRGDVAELIIASGAGIVCTPNSETALVEAVRYMASLTPDQRDEIGKRGPIMIENHFTRPKIVSHYEAIFGDLSL